MKKFNWTEKDEFLSFVIDSPILNNAAEWMNKNLNPDDIFEESDLEQWALDNGFVKGDAND